MPKRSGAKPRRLPENTSQATRGPPRMNPAPEATTRPPGHRICNQSPILPPARTPEMPPASAHTPNRALKSGTDMLCTRAMKVAAHAINPFTANVTIAPPTNTQIKVGVRSTTVAASRNSSNADAATSPAPAVRHGHEARDRPRQPRRHEHTEDRHGPVEGKVEGEIEHGGRDRAQGGKHRDRDDVAHDVTNAGAVPLHEEGAHRCRRAFVHFADPGGG